MTYLWSAEADIIDDIYEVDTIGSPEDQYVRLPRLAEKIEVSTFEDKPGIRNTKITITLRKGLAWQDGETLSSKDYNFTIWYPGKEWKTRRFYSEFEKKIYRTETPNPQAIIVYLEGTSFLYQVAAEGYRPLPEHIYSKLKDPKKDDPGKLSHPNVKGLTMLVGQGPYILKEYVAGTHAVNSWNPLYYMRHPEKGLALSFTKIPTSAFADDVPIEVELKVTDYLNRPVTNATVSATADSKAYTATHVKDGIYRFLVAELPMLGTMSVSVKAEQALPFGLLSKTTSATLTIYLAKWVVAAIVIMIVALVGAVFRFRKRRETATKVAARA